MLEKKSIQQKILFVSILAFLFVVIRFIEAITPNLNYGKTFYQYGLSSQEKGHFSKAAGYFRKAIKHNPGLAQAYFSLGEVLYLLSDCKQAAEMLQKSTQMDPSIDQAYYLLGTIYFKQSNFDGAILEIQKGIKNRRFTFPNNYFYLLGLSSLEVDDLELAKTCSTHIRKNGGMGKLADLLDHKIEQKQAGRK